MFSKKQIVVAPKAMEPVNLYEAMLFLLYHTMRAIVPTDKVDSIFKNMRELIQEYHINHSVIKDSDYSAHCYATLEILRTMAQDEVEELKAARPAYLLRCVNEAGCLRFLKVLADIDLKSIDDISQYDWLADSLRYFNPDVLMKVNVSKVVNQMLEPLLESKEFSSAEGSLKVNVGSDLKRRF
jgi:hypothetical protein